MNKIFKILGLVIIAGISASSFAQNKVYTMQAGSKTFTATSATATSFNWYLNGLIQASQTTSSFANTWSAGIYWLSAAGVSSSCAGDSFDMKIVVKTNVINGGAQLGWATSTYTVCQPSNTNPSGNSTNVQVSLTGYTLGSGETYQVVLAIDGTNQSVITLNIQSGANVLISLVGLTAGTHTVKIAKLIYDVNNDVVDYSNSIDATLSATLNVTAAPSISDIQ